MVEAETDSSQDRHQIYDGPFQLLTSNPFLRSKHVLFMKRPSLGSFRVTAQILLL